MTDAKKPDLNTLEDDWASAMAEQAATPAEDDPWAAALAEQAATLPEPATQNAGQNVFKPLGKSATAEGMRDLDMIMDIPVKLSVELGRTRITIKQLLELAQGSVVELDGLAGEPMDILINGYLIAQGEVVVVDDKYGIRITEIITPSERVQKLNR
ncbi:Flagellar motor switch protein [Azotobacter vinelandii CA]|uniref:Flagellar motor switch protein FliN n=3 Tax=Azotobacter vinelandii TaxID=354 RepID=C1DHK7_AZOVD|nr:flagellar motor switch protein FliN [Azotobacter vinelandii]ACO78602.1 Flagellar motor switch protein [Azotobacter vinelandii DJ]AGK13502.1 Flagellar motor switch protein [Azotobacter vinelandii CA]AGK17916.1 Flagellar motor switch protein [Azotobacter vinelandii CA6]WKN24283.1 flagellar motor switch protein FliN [Azotobacter vinelandii]SFX89822.1 flagellar motor switch protein FliN/FliY [Azotobacter vinelandii]